MTRRPNLLSGEDLPPAPRQKRSLEKRARLKQAALELFGAKGYDTTTIEEVAQNAGLAVGGFYLHFRSKRQLLLALMDDLLEALSQLNLQPQGSGDVRSGLQTLLAGAFSQDLHFLGAYRAWQEAILSDPDLAQKQKQIQTWTTGRVRGVFEALQKLPRARKDVDIDTLARVMDSFFWNLLAQAVSLRKAELERWVNAATHLTYHALFTDP